MKTISAAARIPDGAGMKRNRRFRAALDTTSCNTPRGQTTEQYTRPNSSVSRISAPTVMTLPARRAGTSCILASSSAPGKPGGVSRARNRSKNPPRERLAKRTLSLCNMPYLCSMPGLPSGSGTASTKGLASFKQGAPPFPAIRHKIQNISADPDFVPARLCAGCGDESGTLRTIPTFPFPSLQWGDVWEAYKQKNLAGVLRTGIRIYHDEVLSGVMLQA